MARRRRTDAQRRAAARDYASSRNNRNTNPNAGYNAATSGGRSTTSPGYGQYNATARDEYWGDAAARQYGTTADYNAYRQERGYTPTSNTYATPAAPNYGGGGGGWTAVVVAVAGRR